VISHVPRADAESFLEMDQWGFAYDLDEHEGIRTFIDELNWERTFAADLDGRRAGIYAAFSFDCPLPGGTAAPVGGLTWVAVHPRDRRRGVLTAMIDHHLDDVAHRRGEPFSMLTASEPSIYGRFGYGLASRAATMTVPRGAALRDVPGAEDLVVDFDRADADRHAKPIADCFSAAAAGRPGFVDRPTGGARSPFYDPPRTRRGAESLRLATVTDPADPTGELRGYALFRRRTRWDDGSPNGTVEVSEIIARDPAAARALWGRLVDLDLMSAVETPPLALDDPLLHLLVDVRVVKPRLSDGLWVRLVDVPAALTARRYATAVDVVLEVTDARRSGNTGRWHLTGDPSSAACVPTGASPALEIDVRDLGSAYLGGVSLTALAASGLITVHDPAALTTASVAFGSAVAPWCGWTF
jgi:predicted acetyltransferase